MPDNSTNSKRIAKNTIFLYFRMMLLMLIGLYTSRVNLQALGVTDFGIYNVVGGVVIMFSVVNRSLSSAISRFITFELGKGNVDKLKSVFSTSVNIQLVLSAIILLLSETIGLWFLKEKMVIPSERMNAALWVYQMSVLTFIFNIISIPYNAAIIGHEKMSAFAYLGIVEAVGKLLVAWGTTYATYDKLIVFSILHAAIAILLRMIYQIYCRRNFVECKYKLTFDKTTLRQMTGYAGWSFIGTTSALMRDTGGNIIINLFCGPVVNAARSVSMQINRAVQEFSTNFMTALNPQITKSYARGDKEYMMKLIYKSSRMSFYLLLLLSVPIIINTPYVLEIWLVNPPANSVLFVQLSLIFTMTEAISNPLITANNATGHIRNYQLVVGGIQLLNLPISYALLRLGAMPESVLITAIVVGQCCFVARLYMLRSQIGLRSLDFIKKVYLNVLFVSIISFVLPWFVNELFDDSFMKFVLISLFTLCYTATIIYYIGCNQEERNWIILFAFKGKKTISNHNDFYNGKRD